MTKVRIIEISEEDGFHDDREHLMSMVGETPHFHLDRDSRGVREDGWFHGDIRFPGDSDDLIRFFYMVKVEEVKE